MRQKSLIKKINNQQNEIQQISNQNNKPKGRYRTLTVVLSVLLLVAVGLLVFHLCRRFTDKGDEDQSDVFQEEKTIQWSDWMDMLPDDIMTDGRYVVDQRTLYRSRPIETMSSTTENAIEGWELYDTVSSPGGFGTWSNWSAVEMTASEDMEVEPRTLYRYKTKEKTSAAAANKEGWTLYDTTYSLGDYGAWSGWSTTAVSNSSTRKVESKNQYCYRNISYSTQYTSWSSWGDWVFDRQSTSDTKREDSRTVWLYYRYVCPRCGAYMHGNKCYSWAGGGCKNYPTIPSDGYQYLWYAVSPDEIGYSDFHGTGDFTVWINGEMWFVSNGMNWSERYNFQSETQYRYATRSTMQVPYYGEWSGWSDTPYAESDTREVQVRRVYRYCERTQIAQYHFYRWSDWSDWSTKAVTESEDCQVGIKTEYRYRTRKLVTTYCFQRKGEWTPYSLDYVAQSDSLEVETKTQYRYRPN